MSSHAATSKDGAVRVIARNRVCKGCAYDLRGTIEHWIELNCDRLADLEIDPDQDGTRQSEELSCPECGKPFNPLDTASTSTAAMMKTSRRIVRVWIPVTLLATVLVVHGMLVNWIPIPHAMLPGRDAQWTLFSWLQSDYGLATYTRNGSEIQDWVWDNAITSRAVYDGAGVLRYRVSRESEDRWAMEIRSGEPDYQPILRAFNLTRKGHRFGLRVEPTLYDGSAQATTNIEGTNREILLALVDHFDLKLTTEVRGGEWEDVFWYYNPEERSLEERLLKDIPLEDAVGWVSTPEGTMWIRDGRTMPPVRRPQPQDDALDDSSADGVDSDTTSGDPAPVPSE